MTRRRVLVVDDERPARDLVCSMLRRHPALEVVGEAADGPDAVDQVLAVDPDLVFLDVQMP